MTGALVVVITLGAGLISASFFEWAVHRYLLHRPRSFFRMWFESHTRIHHMVFKPDHSYHLQNEADKEIIDMKRWALVVIGFGSLPYVFVMLVFNFEHEWTMLITGVLLSTMYYCAYEYWHWCMHLPKNRRLERSWLFRRLNGHHLLHHRFMGKNFNVVLPLADWCMGTLITRSAISFKQPRGPAVPDVQPLS